MHAKVFAKARKMRKRAEFATRRNSSANLSKPVEYRVRLTARAQRDLAALYDEVDAERSRTAQRWYEGLKSAILSLEKQPKVWPTTRESSQLRHLVYGSKPHRLYRVIYRID
jgi:plasmid stabilization system protein ParE